MQVLNNSTFFNDLKRGAENEKNRNNTYLNSISNTYQNEPQFQTVQNLSRNYARSGQQKFADPFEIKVKPVYNYDKRTPSALLETLKVNANKDQPDVITPFYLKTVGYY